MTIPPTTTAATTTTAEPPPRGEPPRRPDLDFLPDPFPRARRLNPVDPAGHQRLVVNPFLALAGLIGWGRLIGRLLTSPEPPLALAACLLLAFGPLLLHYHCLDCGATGLWHRWRRHACPRVVIREGQNRQGWLRWPRATTQLVAWVYLLGGLALLIALSRLNP